MGRKARLAAAGLLAALLGAAIAGQVLPTVREEGDKPALGLFTSLPIYWAESADIADALKQRGAEDHWARRALERENRLVPLDTLDGRELKDLDRLVMAQPRPLAPVENVALDEWVRGGGRLLLFADPFLTEHSRFALGDPRRPQGMVLMSPILKRWGLELRFDEDQRAGERIVESGGVALPVDLAGMLAAVPPGAPARCTIEAGGLIAACRVGSGAVTVVADAALLDRDRAAEGGAGTLEHLAVRAFD